QAGAKRAQESLSFDRADNDRIGGWQRMRDMLAESAKEHPEKQGLWFMDCCINTIRTVPMLQHDLKRPDDIDTEQEDHAADDCRYMCSAKARKLIVGSYSVTR